MYHHTKNTLFLYHELNFHDFQDQSEKKSILGYTNETINNILSLNETSIYNNINDSDKNCQNIIKSPANLIPVK